MTKAKKLRELFESKDLVRIVGAHNGLTAKLVELNGFDGVWASGLEVSASHAVPDANILTMSDYLAAAASMNDATSIPVVVDCDTGYGNSMNVIRMVKKFEDAGIAAVCMEDKKFPKTNSLLEGGKQELAPIAEFVGKIMAAKNAQESDDFMVIARVEALIAGWGQEEALKRARAYADAGADAIFIHSKKSDPKEIEDFLKAWDNYKPVVLVPTNYPSFTEAQMKQYGVKLVIYANHGIRTIVKHVNETLAEIKEKGITEIDSKIASVKDLFALQEMDKFKEDQDKFVRTKESVKAIIPAAGDRSVEPSLKELLQDRPLTMIDVNGKSILQRSVENLKQCGVDDIKVIGGYKAEHVVADDINLVVNEAYADGHIMDSISKAGEEYAEKNLIIYSDIIFETEILDKLLKTDKDITLVIDSSVRKSEVRSDIDLVIAEKPPLDGERVINVNKENKILNIGKDLDREKAKHEFVGIVLLSKIGMQKLMQVYKDAGDQKMGLCTAIQKLIDSGEAVNSLEISRGWSEIHDFEDYKKVSEMLATEN